MNQMINIQKQNQIIKKNYIQERIYILEKDNNYTWLNLENKIKDSSLSNNEILSLKKFSDLEIMKI